MPTHDEVACDYVVIGSGAGGGTVAARLAEAGMAVVLLEAGGDYRQITAGGLPEDHDVPAFHPLASELAAPAAGFADDEVRRLVVDAVLGKDFRRSLLRLLRREADPNDQRSARRRFEGAASTPLTTSNHARVGTHQRLRDVASRHPAR